MDHVVSRSDWQAVTRCGASVNMARVSLTMRDGVVFETRSTQARQRPGRVLEFFCLHAHFLNDAEEEI